jgi:hypothetical protein
MYTNLNEYACKCGETAEEYENPVGKFSPPATREFIDKYISDNQVKSWIDSPYAYVELKNGILVRRKEDEEWKTVPDASGDG